MGEAITKEVYTHFATTTRAEYYKVAINQYLEVGKAIYIVDFLVDVLCQNFRISRTTIIDVIRPI